MKSYVGVCRLVGYLFIVLTISLGFVSSQVAVATPCAQVGTSARSYDDCKSHDNATAFTVCCFVQGTSNNSDETSCLDVDILFKDRVIEYISEGVSGKLICKADGANSGRFLTMRFSIALIAVFFILS